MEPVLKGEGAKPTIRGALWKTKEGVSLRIEDMDNTHLLNSIRFMERRKWVVLHPSGTYGGPISNTKYVHLKREMFSRT